MQIETKKHLLLKEKTIPIDGSYDVIVAGGGTAGAYAAISAAMEGMSVLLIEQSGCLGGMSTLGMVSPIMPNYIEGHPAGKLNRNTRLRGELTQWLIDNSDYDDDHHCIFFNPIHLPVALEYMMTKYGAEILYHTTLVDVIKENLSVTHAIVYNKGGLSAIEGKVFIDCTGDADLCSMAGVKTYSGNSIGLNQNISLRFEMAQVDIPTYYAFMNKIENSEGGRDAFMRQKYEEGYLREQDIYHFQTFEIKGKPNSLAFNCPELGRDVNVIDPHYMSRQQIEGKQAVMKLAKFCKECIAGFENAFVTQISPILGIRDSRRIDAEYMLTSDDVYSYRKFWDGIAVSNYPLDAHGERNYGQGIGQYDKTVPTNEQYYEIPLRSLVPRCVDNVLCAGRCAGTDFFTQSTTRIQHTCHYMGEAAGIAASIAAKTRQPIRELDGASVRAVMAERGDILLSRTFEDS